MECVLLKLRTPLHSAARPSSQRKLGHARVSSYSASAGLAGFAPSAPAIAKLKTTNGTPIPNDNLIPQVWATAPNNGGPSKNMTNDVWASAATLITAARSVRWAAADIASGKIALVPTPIPANPSNDRNGEGE